MTAKILMVYPLVSREYTDRENQQKVFKSKAIIIHNGKSSIYAEAIQDMADQVESQNVKIGDMVNIYLTCRAREYTDAKGSKRVANEVTINNLIKW